jgi:hypothetical protein
MAETGNIKTYESPIDKLTPTEVGAEAYEMMGRHVAAVYHQAGESIGGAVSSLGEQIEQHETTMQTADIMKNMSDLEVQAQKGLLNAKNTMDINDPDAVNKYMSGFQEQTDAIQNKTYTSRAYDTMTRMMSDFNTRTRNNFTGYQMNAQANEGMANFETAANNYAVVAGQDPSTAKASADQIQLAAQNLPGEHRATLTIPAVNHVYDTGAERMVGSYEGAKVFDPASGQAIKDYINDPKNGYVAAPGDTTHIGMSAAKYNEVMNRLDNAHRTGANQSIADITLNSGAMLNTVGLTGQVSDDLAAQMGQLDAIYKGGGTQANEAKTKYDELAQAILDKKGTYQARQLTSSLPSDQLASAQDMLKNETLNSKLSGSQQAVIQATQKQYDELLNQRHEAFNGSDPVKQGQWNIDNNPAIRNAYDTWRANPNPQTFLNYYQKSLGNQRYLEPTALPSFLTDDIVNDAHKVQNEITHNLDPNNPDKAGPIKAAQDLDNMSKMYGPAWPSIAGDLAKKGVFNGTQLVAATLTNPSQAGWRRTLLEASAMPDKELNERMAPEKARDMVRPQIDALFKSMGNLNNAPEMEDIYVNAAAKIVQLNGLTDATQLVKTMYLDNFQFVGPGSTIRLGAGVPNGDAIGAGSRNVLHDIGNHDLVIPSTERLGSINAKEAWSDSVKANGVWYTSRDGQSAMLYDGPATKQPVMERNKQGKIVPVQISFAELARLGSGSHLAQSAVEAEESHVK